MENSYFANSFDEVFNNVTGQECPLCTNIILESRAELRNHFEYKHFRYSIVYEIDGKEVCILPCRKDCYFEKRSPREYKRSHFHCPFCKRAYGRSSSFKRHLYSLQGKCRENTLFKEANDNFELNQSFRLVKEVEKYEELYNSESDRYHDEGAKSLAWKAVATALQESEKSCQEKWAKVKAAYLLHNEASPMPQSFAVDVLGATKTGNGLSSLQHTVEIVTETTSLPNDALSREVDVKPVVNALCPYKSIGTAFIEERLAESNDEVEGNKVGSVRKRKLSSDKDSEEADMAFFRSMLPDLNRMNHRQKNRFKRTMLEAIDDILYKDDESSSIILGQDKR